MMPIKQRPTTRHFTDRKVSARVTRFKLTITSATVISLIDDRVEVLVPLEETSLRRQIMARVFEPCWRDSRNSWDLEGDGSYVRHSGGEVRGQSGTKL